MLDEFDFLKNKHICKKIRFEMEQRNVLMWDIAKKLWTSQPYISQKLSWTSRGKDVFYVEVMKVLWMSDDEIKDVFYQADLEVLWSKYWDSVKDIQFETYLKEIKGLSEDEIKKVKDYLDFISFNK